MPIKVILAPVTVHVCTMCSTTPHSVSGKPQANPLARQLVQQLRSGLSAQAPEQEPFIKIRLSRCLGACEHPQFQPCAYAYTSPGHETLVFWHGGNQRDAAHITASVLAYARNRPGKRYREPHLPKAERSLCFARVPAPPAVATSAGLPSPALPSPAARSKPEHD